LNPVSKVDPLGLESIDGFGSGFGDYCRSIETAASYLPQEDAEQVIHNAEKMHNVYSPLGEYVQGIAIGAPIIGMAGIGMGVIPLAEKGAACIENTAETAITEGERDPKNLMLTCAKGFINKGSTSFQGKVSDYLIDALPSYSQKQ